MTEWLAIIFLCVGANCQFVVHQETYASEAKCIPVAQIIAHTAESRGASVAAACVRVPEKKAADASS